MIIKHPLNYFQGSIAGLESSVLLQSEKKKNLESFSKSLSDSQKSLKKLEQLSWNVDRTGEIGKWDIARGTNFQVDSEKHPYLNAALRGVNNTTGFVACIENVATNAAGTILFDLPAAIEDLSVEHGGPSFEELVVSMQGATPGVPDELVPYFFSRLSSTIRTKQVVTETEQIANNVHDFIKLKKGLASEGQMKEVGFVIAGGGHSKKLRAVNELVKKYGGNTEDWVKKRSSAYHSTDGAHIRVHWYENIKTGFRVEQKTKIEEAFINESK